MKIILKHEPVVKAEETNLVFDFDKESKTCKVERVKNRNIIVDKIPSKVQFDDEIYSVTEIRWGAFCECYDLTSIEIPNSVTTIGWGAFDGCTSLTSIEIPNSVTEIGEWAFSKRTSLTSIVVDKDNKVYDSRENCNAIIETASNKLIAGCQNTVIPESVTSIGSYAFYYCRNLTSIEIPNSVTEIGDGAFEYCDSLTSIEIPNSVTTIGKNAFYYCTNLKKARVPVSLEGKIGYVFPSTCGIEWYDPLTGKTTIRADKTVLKFEYNDSTMTAMVYGLANKELKEVKIPSHVLYDGKVYDVTSIGERVFYYCGSLKSIEIPESVTEIGGGAFGGCTSLTSIVVDKNNKVYDSRENCNAIIETASNKLIAGCQNTVIPNSVTEIGGSAFAGCYNLTSIVIPNSVTSIGSRAFINCQSLTSVEIGNSVTEIGDYAFNGCTKLASIEIPNSVTEIGESAFWHCTGLTSIEIPNSVTTIGYEAFYGCTGLTSIELGNSVTTIGDEAFLDCRSLTSIEIPNSVTTIGENAFYGCTRLTSIVIPNSVTEIGDWAFDGCTSLTSIVVDKYNKVYDSRENCNAIIETASNKLLLGCQNTVIPNSVTSIGKIAFRYCIGLTSIEIPNSVTEIGRAAFVGCKNLKTARVPKNCKYDSYYTFPDECTIIKY